MSRFSFKVRQSGQQQLYLQYKVCWIFYKLVGAPSFQNPTCIYNHTYNLPQKSVPLFQLIFTCLFHSHLFTKSSFQYPLTLPFSISLQFFTYLFLHQFLLFFINLYHKYFPHLSNLVNSGRVKGPGI